jgi:hypothetical protein
VNAKLIFVILLSVVLSLPAFSQNDEHEPDHGYSAQPAYPQNTASGTATSTEEFQEQVVLDPRVVAVEENFHARLDALQSQAEGLSWEEEKTLMRQTEALKREWHIELTKAYLEIARENGDEKAIADMTAHLNKLENPPVRQHQVIERDPVTGEPVEGGQR